MASERRSPDALRQQTLTLAVSDLCIRNKKIFSHEHTLHTHASLNAHIAEEHGHCDFCREHFYSEDELFIHMRDRHEQCHLCKAKGGEEERWRYYKDYNMLVRGTRGMR